MVKPVLIYIPWFEMVSANCNESSPVVRNMADVRKVGLCLTVRTRGISESVSVGFSLSWLHDSWFG